MIGKIKKIRCQIANGENSIVIPYEKIGLPINNNLIYCSGIITSSDGNRFPHNVHVYIGNGDLKNNIIVEIYIIDNGGYTKPFIPQYQVGVDIILFY